MTARPGDIDPNAAVARSAASRRPPSAVPAAAVVAVAAYASAQMLADVASVKIGVVFGLAVDMGTFVYPLTFTLRDLVHKTVGRIGARVLIVTAAAANLFMAAYLSWAARVPSDEGWGQGDAFAAVFAPVGRIVVASIVAEVVSELVDTEVYHAFVTRISRDRQWMRVLASNSVSVPLDSLIFSVLAFAPLPGMGGLPWSSVRDVFLFNLAVKYAVTLASLPLIYLVPERASEER
jgi:hypothetical protein